MIQFIADKLNQWGRWSARRDDNGLGYGNSPLARYGEAAGTGGVGIMLDTEMLELDHIIVCLPFDLRMAVIQCHREHGTKEQHAVRCACSVRTYFNRVHKAHNLIMEAMQLGIKDVPELLPGMARLDARVQQLKKSLMGGLTGSACTV